LHFQRRWLNLKVFGVVRLPSTSAARRMNAFAGVGATVLLDRSSLPLLNQMKCSARPMSGSAALASIAPSSSDLIRGHHKLRVTDLPEDANEEMLRAHFSQFGSVLSCEVVRDKDTKISRQHAYVVFARKEEVDFQFLLNQFFLWV
jgi:hypothetical protein